MEKDKKYYIFELNLKTLNISAILVAIILIVLTQLFGVNILEYLINSNINIILLFVIMFLYLALHEILHSIGYVIHGAKFKNIVYGIALEKGVFYCLCKQNISRKNILYTSMYPLFFIGIITYIIGTIFNLPLLVILSIINISGSTGDIFTFLYIIKLKDISFSEIDDETAFAIYSAQDVSKVKHFGLKYIKCVPNIERKDLKKVKISKASYIVLAVILVLLLLDLILK